MSGIRIWRKTGLFSSVAGGYNKGEETEMARLQRAYTENISNDHDLPIQFKTEEKGTHTYPCASTDSSEYKSDYWKKQKIHNKTGSFYTLATDLIATVCKYQLKRSLRKGIHKNDPINLLCQEANVWFSQLATQQPSDALIKELAKRKSYYRAISRAEEFQPSRFHDLTMKGTLERIDDLIDESVVKAKNDIAQKNAREHINELMGLNKSINTEMFKIMRGLGCDVKGAHTDIIAKNILDPDATETRALIQTRLGQCLQVIAMELVQGIYSQSEYTANPFIDEKGQAQIPEALQQAAIADDKTSQKYKTYTIDQFFKNKSGIDTEYLKTNNLDNLIKLFAYVMELTKINVCLKDAYELAGVGGDIMLYGNTHTQIVDLIEEQQLLIGAINLLLKTLQAPLAENRKRRVAKNTAKVGLTRAKDTTIANYEAVEDSIENIFKSFEQNQEQCEKILAEAKKMTLRQRINEANKKAKRFVKDTSDTIVNIQHVMGREVKRTDERFIPMELPRMARTSSNEFLYSSIVENAEGNLPISSKEEDFNGPDTFSARQYKNKSEANNIQNDYGYEKKEVDFYGHKGRQFDDGAINLLESYLMQYPSLSRVILSKHQLTSDGVEKLVDIMAEYNQICMLDLWNNQSIGSKGGEHLATLLKTQKRITALVINQINLGAEGAIEFAVGLAQNKSLRFLDMGYNNLGDTGCEALAAGLKSHPCQDLRLAGNSIGDNGVTALVDARLDSKLFSLLDLGNNKIAQAGACQIAKLVEGNKVVELRLHENKINGIGAKFIASALKNNSTLQEIQLQMNQIDFDGCISLLTAFANHPTLKKLTLAGNEKLTPSQATIIKRLETMIQLHRDEAYDDQTTLDLSGIAIDVKEWRGVLKVIGAFSEVQVLKLNGAKLDNEAGDIMLREITNGLLEVLTSVEAEGNSEIMAGVTKKLATGQEKKERNDGKSYQALANLRNRNGRDGITNNNDIKSNVNQYLTK